MIHIRPSKCNIGDRRTIASSVSFRVIEISKFLLTSFWFRSDLSLFGSGVFAASRMQLTKMVNKMKYSKGLSSVKEYMIRTQTHRYVKLENKISQEHATETVQIDQENLTKTSQRYTLTRVLSTHAQLQQ